MIPEWKFYGPGRLYFLEAQGHIKIGFTNMLKRRIYLIGANNPIPPVLLLAIPGDKDFESYTHFQFNHLRVKQDWFLKAPELLQCIEELRAEHLKNGAPVEGIQVQNVTELSH